MGFQSTMIFQMFSTMIVLSISAGAKIWMSQKTVLLAYRDYENLVKLLRRNSFVITYSCN